MTKVAEAGSEKGKESKSSSGSGISSGGMDAGGMVESAEGAV